MPEQIEEVTVVAPVDGYALVNLLKDAGLTASTSEAIRMINQGAVRIDGERVEDAKLRLAGGSRHVYQVGKRKFLKIVVEST